jgi:hypothetical protein
LAKGGSIFAAVLWARRLYRNEDVMKYSHNPGPMSLPYVFFFFVFPLSTDVFMQERSQWGEGRNQYSTPGVGSIQTAGSFHLGKGEILLGLHEEHPLCLGTWRHQFYFFEQC